MASSQCTPALKAEDRGPALLGIALSTWVVAIVAVTLRFVSRRIAGIGYQLDDWTIVAATVVSGAYCFVVIPALLRGTGKHTLCLETDDISYFLKVLFAWSLVYIMVMTLVKYSVLLFYRRLFPVYDFKKYFWALCTTSRNTSGLCGDRLTTVWGISICQPLSDFWLVDIVGKDRTCINTTMFFFGSSIPHIILDAAIVALPIPWVMRLQLPRALRLSLLGVFACGGLVVVISCYRLNVVIKFNNFEDRIDITYTTAEAIKWTIIENNIAIVSACLPSMAPLVRRMVSRLKSRRSSADADLRRLELHRRAGRIMYSKTFSVHSETQSDQFQLVSYRADVERGPPN